ncbi:hypothetical protein TPHA_0B02770 [Tetrapisispora phaffii CBS 4417]|uniref:Calcineurin-like phosphoesterase domain-containing protein n=1 Tax=Tetrapisispora phaffii (strain ATCC 24235 / CBS 4417 / NBRC 1672 / NRRL Y-8282 / UCD 70-5) TaxID=1071381 RepID=G8BPL8_TETPH|nr:hypothetical protein TPHA_0B02770 [Tetrapisispora phaffii CBS 4417]CCE61949.1 hypothetical protein TPHA_0B02770 [Tetrapisispora phaffii CBS 4417]
MILRFLIKVSFIIASLVVLTTNIYIYTYPSVHPTKCFWHCNELDFLPYRVKDASKIELALYYSYRYIKDVTKQMILKRYDEETVNKTNEIRLLAFGDPQIKGNSESTPYRTRLDTFGNDFYLGHIFDTMVRRLNPTHVAVMGDLFSSQWIDDSEFYNRTSRYMRRIFKRNTDILFDINNESHDENGQYQVNTEKWIESKNLFSYEFENIDESTPIDNEFGYEDLYSWDEDSDPTKDSYLFINTTGNHDIGYSGDITYELLARYNEMFGKDNYWVEYNKGKDNAWRIVVLNTLLLDGPAYCPELLDNTWEFLYQVHDRNFSGSTVLITHVPFYKPEGICADGPQFTYYDDEMLRSQNHISEENTNEVFDLIFDNGKSGIILTGHDHMGCETYYDRKLSDNSWVPHAGKLLNYNNVIREITVKSMMGQYKGNTGVVTGKFDQANRTWSWHYSTCPFTNEHAWWIAKGSLVVWSIIFSIFILV